MGRGVQRIYGGNGVNSFVQGSADSFVTCVYQRGGHVACYSSYNLVYDFNGGADVACSSASAGDTIVADMSYYGLAGN